MPMTILAEKVREIVHKIPKGETLTYKEVAKLAGSPRACRAVGNILSHNRDFRRVPCHRVIRSDGKVGGYVFGVKKKYLLLRQEGLSVISKKLKK